MAEVNIAKYNFLEKGIVKIIHGDGSKGYSQAAPYDKIIAAASGNILPQAWKEQINIGGRIVVPINSSIWVFDKIGDNIFEKKTILRLQLCSLNH